MHPCYEDVYTCNNCNKNTSREGTIINMNLPTHVLIFLEDAFSSVSKDFLGCKTCSHILDRRITLSHHLFIELKRLNEDTCFTEDLEIQLKDIPEQLKIEDKDFQLRGAIHFYLPGRSITSFGHYITYCWRASIGRWQYFNDMRRGPKYVDNTTKFKTQLLIYVTIATETRLSSWNNISQQKVFNV